MDPRPQPRPQPKIVEPSSEKTVPLDDEREAVLRIEQESKQRLEPDILELRSSAANVMAWWHTRDPLFNKKDSHKLSKEEFHNYIETLGKLRICGALTLLVDVASGGLSKEESERANKMLQDAEIQEPNSFFRSFSAISRLAIEQINKRIEGKKLFSVEEAKRLFTVAQLLMGNFKFPGTQTEGGEFLKQVRYLLTNVLDIIEGFRKTVEYMDDIRMLGIKGSVLKNTWAEKSKTLEEQKLEPMVTTKHESLLSLLEDIWLMFFGPKNESNTIRGRLRSREIKGPLHEVIWYLDVTMLRHMYPEKYGFIFIKPSYSYADEPTINYTDTANNRAYDYYMFFRDKKGETIQDFVQLKSGRKNQKIYHPHIHVLREQNFMDVSSEGGRLQNKIEFYRQIVEGGFKASDADKLKLNDFVLPSAKGYLEDFAKRYELE